MPVLKGFRTLLDAYKNYLKWWFSSLDVKIDSLLHCRIFYMNIAFYLTNKYFCSKDCSDLSKGNPGIGGTYYAMLQVSYALSSIMSNGVDKVYLLMEEDMKVPDYVKKVVVTSKESLVDAINSLDLDYLVLNKIGPDTLSPLFFDEIRTTGIDTIVWVHCSISEKVMNQLSKEPLVKKVVAVSRLQFYTWYDHDIIKKATYIYNMFDMVNPRPIIEYGKRKNDVVYVGAINSVKGVHHITKAWKKVKTAFPDSNLYIIGSGKLYSAAQECGQYNIAEKYYEYKLLKPILKNGSIDSSVHFLGVMGEEKWDVLNKCRVGISNASSWETFGYTMLEMQLAGMQVTSIKSPGLIDTMNSKSGILYEKPKDLAKSIIALLQNNSYNYSEGVEYAKHTFDANTIVPQWVDLFHGKSKPEASISDIIKTVDFPYLKFVVFNKTIRNILPFLPSVTFYRGYIESFKRIVAVINNPSKIRHKISTVINNKI